jgi:tetratricopeptide (TPR) repeat protein
LRARQYDYTGALALAERGLEAAESYVAFNPSNMAAWDYPVRAYAQKARLQFELGDVDASVATLQSGIEMQHDKRLPSSLLPQLGQLLDQLYQLQVRTGDQAGLDRLRPVIDQSMAESLATLPPKDPARIIWPMFTETLEIEQALFRGNDEEAYRRAVATMARMDSIEPEAGSQASRDKQFLLRRLLAGSGYAALFTDHPEEAVRFFEQRLVTTVVGTEAPDLRAEKSRFGAAIAHAKLKQGRTQEAIAQVKESLAFYREAQSRGAKSVTFNNDYAYALYVDALARPNGDSQRARNLAEAQRLLDALAPAAQRLLDVRRLHDWIVAAGA